MFADARCMLRRRLDTDAPEYEYLTMRGRWLRWSGSLSTMWNMADGPGFRMIVREVNR